MSVAQPQERASFNVSRRECAGNRQRLAEAQGVFAQTLAQAAVAGFFGEVCVHVTFQDGVAQSVRIERSQMIR